MRGRSDFSKARRWVVILAMFPAACGGPSRSGNELFIEPSSGDESAETPTHQPPKVASEPADPSQETCVELAQPELATEPVALQLSFACGTYSVARQEQSEFLSGGKSCSASDGLNTFALKIGGSAAGEYSPVVRCGYIRYDNGTFVGERFEVEARDGQWCHDLALKRIELVDRMLLTDVSFALEPKEAAPARRLSVQFDGRGGWTALVPAEESLCAYVAFREQGYAACGMVPPAPYCVCPCGSGWEDFFSAMTLSLVAP